MLPLAVRSDFHDAQRAHSSTSPEVGLFIEQDQSSLADKLGIIGSSLCLVHCLVLPFLLPLFQASSYSSHIDGVESYFHLVIFPILLAVALLAFKRGFKVHHSKPVLFAGLTAIFLVFLGLVIEQQFQLDKLTTWLTSLGSFILVISHLGNLTLIRASKNHIHGPNCSCKRSKK